MDTLDLYSSSTPTFHQYKQSSRSGSNGGPLREEDLKKVPTRRAPSVSDASVSLRERDKKIESPSAGNESETSGDSITTNTLRKVSPAAPLGMPRSMRTEVFMSFFKF